MKKTIFLSLGLIALAFSSCKADEGKLTVKVPADFDRTEIVVERISIDNLVKAKSRQDLKPVYDTLPLNSGVAEMTLPESPSQYIIDILPDAQPEFFARGGDKIVMDIQSVTPLKYTVAGTPLVEGATELRRLTDPLQVEYEQMVSNGTATEESVQQLMVNYDKTVSDFIRRHAASEAATIGMLELGGQEFLDRYAELGEEAKKAVVMPMVEIMKGRAERQAASERLQKELTSGTMDAPAFTFKNLQGKNVSLSDFKGKWVVLDFWGSWCPWCIKGFPALKDAYAKYKGKLEVIGIDCRDPEDAWRAAVKKYDLPWVNVYNNQEDGALLSAYGVEGFPTKAIVSPDGKLVDITVGEDPSFFQKLSRFIEQ